MGSITTNALVSQQIAVMTFNGQSKYSSDFQTVLAKAVQTDSIHLSGLDDSLNTNQSELSALQGIDSALSSLQSAISALQSSTGSSSLAANVANSSLATASLGSGAMAGTYSLEVDDLGAASQSISSSGAVVTDPSTQTISSSDSSFQLSVSDPSVNGGVATSKAIPSDGTLQGLVNYINSNPSLGVSASIVNVGSQSSPSYKLALQANNLGAVNISLTGSTSGTQFLSTVTTGRNSSYKVDGTAISGTSDAVQLAPGVNVQLTGTSVNNPTTVTVSEGTSAVQTALQNFATAYNSVVSTLAAQHGQNAGALSGNSLLEDVSQALSAINGYSSNGSGLSSLGLDLSSDGQITFNSSEFATGLGNNFSQLSQFLGNTTTGFIAAATNGLNGLEDPTNGVIKKTETNYNTTIAQLQSEISDEISNVNQFQQNLYNSLSASDAAIFSLNNQESFFQNMFQTMNAALTGGL